MTKFSIVSRGYARAWLSYVSTSRTQPSSVAELHVVANILQLRIATCMPNIESQDLKTNDLHNILFEPKSPLSDEAVLLIWHGDHQSEEEPYTHKQLRSVAPVLYTVLLPIQSYKFAWKMHITLLSPVFT